MNDINEIVEPSEQAVSQRIVVIKGDSFTLAIEEHDQFTGHESEPSYIDLKFTIKSDGGRTVEFVAMEPEAVEILKGINHALALKQERDKELRREDARVDAIEELIRDFEDRLTCELNYTVMDRYADLYDMTYDELMAEKGKMNAEATADTPDE